MLNSAAIQALASSLWPHSRVVEELERADSFKLDDYADSLVRRAVPREPKIERCLITLEVA